MWGSSSLPPPLGHGVLPASAPDFRRGGAPLGIAQACAPLQLPALVLYAEYITQNARLDEAQAGIKIAGKNINNLRYPDDTTVMAEREEELKSLLMKMKEEIEKAGLKLNI